METSNKLVLFTLEFPFGNGEAFLENEIVYLAKAFDEVYIIPSDIRADSKRTLPDNVHILSKVAESPSHFKPHRIRKYLTSFITAYAYSLLHSQHPVSYIKFFRSLTHYFYKDIQKSKIIEKLILKHDLSAAKFYDYWLLNSSLALIRLKKQGKIKNLVCRAHRFDLYDEQHIEGVVPFKEYKIKNVDRLVTISKHGENYLKSQLKPELHSKVVTHYLGVKEAFKVPTNRPSQNPIIVSCSYIKPLKQVDKIAKAIRNVKSPMTWVHFGDGPDMERLKRIISTFPDHIKTQFPGFVPNSEVLKFYSENHVTSFISLSQSEGLPVSMMEAISYGIPIIAPALDGIPEIVNKSTGVLLKHEYSINEVTDSINDILTDNLKFSNEGIIGFFVQNFMAKNNYESFIQEVLKD